MKETHSLFVNLVKCMKFGTSEPHNCFEEQVKISTEQSAELSTSSPGSVCFPM